MAHDFNDMRGYIDKIEKMGLLKRINGADWNLEIGGLSNFYRRTKAVLFDNIKGYPAGYRVITGLVASEAQLKLLIGAPMEYSTIEIVKFMKDRLYQFKPVPPRMVKTGPVFENVLTGDDVDLYKFPVPKLNELDGGRYIGTQDLVITKDPDEDWVNFGAYRVMIQDKKTTGSYISPGKHGGIMREKYWSRGKACPVAVVCGGDPTLQVPAGSSVAYGVSEYDYAGWLKGEPIEIVPGPYTGLPIPATAEIVLEGEIPPPEVESRVEGPVGEFSGYYASGARTEPVIRVKSICFRNDPILSSQAMGNVPSHRLSYMRSALLWDELEKTGVPDIKGVWKMETGGAYFTTCISIKQRYPGHARHAGLAAAGCREGAYANHLTIVVEDDIDPSIEDDVWWSVASRCAPASDIEIIRGNWSTPLDPRIEPAKRKVRDYTSSRAIIYAVRPYHWMKEYPPVVRHNRQFLEDLARRFKDQVSDIAPEELKRLVRAKVYR